VQLLESLPLIAVSGVLLGLHFSSWVWSLDNTSLAHSLMWVSTSPVVLNWGQWILFGIASVCISEKAQEDTRSLEAPLLSKQQFSMRGGVRRPSVLETIGGLFAVLGGVIMLIDSIQTPANKDISGADSVAVSLIGDTAAFCAAVFFCGYLLIGKVVRQGKSMPIFTYMTIVSFFAAATCTLLSAVVPGEGITLFPSDSTTIERAAFGFFWNSKYLLACLYLGGGSGVGGHTLINTLLTYFSPMVISVSLLMEPLVGSLIGRIFNVQGQIGLYTLLGAPVLLFGLILILKGEAEAKDMLKTPPAGEAEAKDLLKNQARLSNQGLQEI